MLLLGLVITFTISKDNCQSQATTTSTAYSVPRIRGCLLSAQLATQ